MTRTEPGLAVDQLLRIADVCRLLCVSRGTLVKLIDRGELPAARIGARAVRIRQSAVSAYIRRVEHPRENAAQNGSAPA
jgi:excisionase family DNA binding protein